MIYDFKDMLNVSMGQRSDSDVETIKSMLHGCASVVKNNVDGDDKGIDYIANLRRGTQVMIDAKTRQRGCSRYWREEPELAIEIYSVMPGGAFKTPETRSKVGWTLDESKMTDMILYTFDPSDSTTSYLLPFQSLRIATANNYKKWMNKHKVGTQTSGAWQSQAVFVPASFVIDEIKKTFKTDFVPSSNSTSTNNLEWW